MASDTYPGEPLESNQIRLIRLDPVRGRIPLFATCTIRDTPTIVISQYSITLCPTFGDRAA